MSAGDDLRLRFDAISGLGKLVMHNLLLAALLPTTIAYLLRPRFNGACPPANASTIGRRPGTSTMPASALG
jgi:hypothetical protein